MGSRHIIREKMCSGEGRGGQHHLIGDDDAQPEITALNIQFPLHLSIFEEL